MRNSLANEVVVVGWAPPVASRMTIRSSTGTLVSAASCANDRSLSPVNRSKYDGRSTS